ncbi:MAG: acetylglutamate kinase [Bacteroidota bacterium]
MIYVVKTGGKVLSSSEASALFLQNFQQLSEPKILVHGGGNRATQIAKQLGVETKMVEGRRITTTEMIEVVTMVYSGINKNLVAKLQHLGVDAIGLTGADLNLIEAIKRPVKEIDYGWVGDIVGVNAERLHALLADNMTPVMAPLTHDKKGHLLNTNADTIASSVASALAKKATSLVLCFEKIGVMLDPNDDRTVIEEIDELDFDAYRAEGIIADGMIPKLHNAFEALRSGVEKVFICNAQNLVNLGSTDFVGTEVVLRSTKSIS